jgi:hypothetical protein
MKVLFLGGTFDKKVIDVEEPLKKVYNPRLVGSLSMGKIRSTKYHLQNLQNDVAYYISEDNNYTCDQIRLELLMAITAPSNHGIVYEGEKL